MVTSSDILLGMCLLCNSVFKVNIKLENLILSFAKGQIMMIFFRPRLCHYKTYIGCFQLSVIKPKQSNYSDQSQQMQAAKWTNRNSSKFMLPASSAGKRLPPSQTQLVLVLFLLGWKSAMTFSNQSQDSKNQANTKLLLTLDWRLL